MMAKHVMNTETVHNWRARYDALPYYGDLSPSARSGIRRAHDDLHKTGCRTANEAAESLIDLYPNELSETGQ